MSKRIFDVVIAILVLGISLPVLVLLALLIRIWLGRPVLFVQVRPGLHGKPFRMVKFRTMTDKRDKHGRL
ncbi:sugar transferase, partial [Pantoea sp. SIMBA_133]